jgi:hypothetical protein
MYVSHLGDLVEILHRYEDRFEGVLLAHEVVVNGDRAKILNGLVPYFGVPVHANLLLYSPQPDMILGKLDCWWNPSSLPNSISLVSSYNHVILII